MMLRHRVIPILLTADNGLVKTRRYRSPVYVGDPTNVVRIFNEKEVDELALVDIERGKRGLGPNFELVERVASECFSPLAYGGGVRSVADAKVLFSLGVEKIILHGAALANLGTIGEIAAHGGNQSVTVAVDVRRNRLGRMRLYNASSQHDDPRTWLDYLASVEIAGAGEVLLTSVAREGSMEGLDLDMIRQAAAVTNVPLVAHGGVGTLDDVASGIRAGADAVAVGSFCVFKGPRRGVLISYPDYSDLEARLGRITHD